MSVHPEGVTTTFCALGSLAAPPTLVPALGWRLNLTEVSPRSSHPQPGGLRAPQKWMRPLGAGLLESWVWPESWEPQYLHRQLSVIPILCLSLVSGVQS